MVMLRKMFSNAKKSKDTAPSATAHAARPMAKKIIARMEYLRRRTWSYCENTAPTVGATKTPQIRRFSRIDWTEWMVSDGFRQTPPSGVSCNDHTFSSNSSKPKYHQTPLTLAPSHPQYISKTIVSLKRGTSSSRSFDLLNSRHPDSTRSTLWDRGGATTTCRLTSPVRPSET